MTTNNTTMTEYSTNIVLLLKIAPRYVQSPLTKPGLHSVMVAFRDRSLIRGNGGGGGAYKMGKEQFLIFTPAH